jgi:hypothetical protein
MLFPKDEDEIDSLVRAFNRFNQQFDRGLLVQSGITVEKSSATIETLLADIGMFLSTVRNNLLTVTY